MLEATVAATVAKAQHDPAGFAQVAVEQLVIFYFGEGTFRVTLIPMNPSPDREERIAAAAERIHASIADLPNEEEQREAEARALVTSVPEKLPFTEQLRAFTGITHVMRVMMARQLESPFREHLRDESPRENLEIANATELRADLAARKKAFAQKTTDDIFALGLAARWADRPCHLLGNKTTKSPRGEYLIVPCRESKALRAPANWTEEYVSQIGLMDAAEPRKLNCLSPAKSTTR